MVKVKYTKWSRFGNHLFTYCIGRILADRFGYHLNAEVQGADIQKYIHNFPNFKEKVNGKIIKGPELNVAHSPQELSHRIHEVNHNPRKLIVQGEFQRYEYYQPHKKNIKQWLNFNKPSPQAGGNDLVIHIRIGDFKNHGWLLPFSFYEKCIEYAKPSKIYLVTDSPKDSYFSQFDKYNHEIISESPWDDFAFISSSDQICVANSTFSWWAAFLSNAGKIYAPLFYPRYPYGPSTLVDHYVWDEKRYHYVSFDEPYPFC